MSEPTDNTTKVMLDEMAKVGATADEVGLIAKLMSANLHDYMGTTESLIEGYKRQILELHAELSAIRTGVNTLFSGTHMPREYAIIKAVFYPSSELIEVYRKQLSGGDNE